MEVEKDHEGQKVNNLNSNFCCEHHIRKDCLIVISGQHKFPWWSVMGCVSIWSLISFLKIFCTVIIKFIPKSPDAKTWLIEKDPDAGKDGRTQETGDEMFALYHQLSGHEFKQTPGDSDRQRSLAYYSQWGCKESDTTWNNYSFNACILNAVSSSTTL